jgi:hypothetical protein
MNVEIGTEAAQFLLGEYINRNLFEVQWKFPRFSTLPVGFGTRYPYFGVAAQSTA